LTNNLSRPTDEILDTKADICAIEERNLFPVEDVEDGAIFAAEIEAIDLCATMQVKWGYLRYFSKSAGTSGCLRLIKRSAIRDVMNIRPGKEPNDS